MFRSTTIGQLVIYFLFFFTLLFRQEILVYGDALCNFQNGMDGILEMAILYQKIGVSFCFSFFFCPGWTQTSGLKGFYHLQLPKGLGLQT